MTVAELPTTSRLPQRFLLHNMAWKQYEALVELFAEQRVFITYNQGTLEMMSPSPRHEKLGLLVARLIHIYTEARGIDICSLGMTTWRRADLERGLEADQCFYIQNEASVRDTDEIDLQNCPPPDLAVEVDLSHSSADKEGVYASLGIPEIWRYEDDELFISVLGPNQKYSVSKTSPALPELPIAVVKDFMSRRFELGETRLIKAFREWVLATFPPAK